MQQLGGEIMSLGSMQKKVLDYVKDSEKPVHSKDMARGLCGEEDVPHSFDVSMRRAINSLAEKGKVKKCMTSKKVGYYERKSLTIWSPGDHEKPDCHNHPSGKEIEETIIEKTKEWIAEEKTPYGSKGYIPYSGLVKEVAFAYKDVAVRETISKVFIDNWLQVAVHRAVKRLEEGGKIEVQRKEGKYYESMDLYYERDVNKIALKDDVAT